MKGDIRMAKMSKIEATAFEQSSDKEEQQVNERYKSRK